MIWTIEGDAIAEDQPNICDKLVCGMIAWISWVGGRLVAGRDSDWGTQFYVGRVHGGA